MFKKFAYLFITTASFFALFSCASKESNVKSETDNSVETNDSIPVSVKSLVRAVKSGNAADFAELVSYPLERPYPLKDIASEEEMKAYYPILVDDSLRNVIVGSKADSWGEYGWRGWSVDGGEYLWIDDDIYAVTYVSKREQQMIDSLTNIEISSLPLNLRNGWKPIMALKSADKTNVYRIDMRTDGKQRGGHHYRLSIYNDDGNLRKNPDQIYDGVIEIEGSANLVRYIFHDKNGVEYDILPESPSLGGPVMILPNDSTIELDKAYWHELIK